MSYEKVKRVWFENGKVFINSACNNVRPLSYSNWVCDSLTLILRDKGKEKAEIEILKAYCDGSFQAGSQNKYTKALKVLLFELAEEYKKFNWRVIEWGKMDEYNELKKSEEFERLLRKALNYKLSKKRFIIKRLSDGMYLLKTTSRRGFFTDNKERAKQFQFKQLAEDVKSAFSNLELEVQEVEK